MLAAPTKVPEVEVSKDAIDKLIAIARREFDHVIVDVGSRIDVAAKALFEDASTIYLVTQTGISELRNSNRLISQFFTEGNRNLEIVINRFDSRFHETVNEDVIAKALGRPVRWKIPNDQDAARALQSGDTGLAETRISRISLEMASSITGRPVAAGKEDAILSHRGRAEVLSQADSGNDEPPGHYEVRLRPVRTRLRPLHGRRPTRLPTETSSPSPSSMPQHRLRELLFTRPAQAMCCRWERTRSGSHSLRQIPTATLRCRPQLQLL